MKSSLRTVHRSSTFLLFAWVLLVAVTPQAHAADYVVVLAQGWTEEDRAWFYRVNQGSRLERYDWFLALVRPQENQELMRDPKYLESLHFLSQPNAANQNPDNLPIGFISDPGSGASPSQALGITFAACHTGQVNYQGKSFRIDGGPGHGDIQRFLQDLGDALHETQQDDAKFQRFAARLPSRLL